MIPLELWLSPQDQQGTGEYIFMDQEGTQSPRLRKYWQIISIYKTWCIWLYVYMLSLDHRCALCILMETTRMIQNICLNFFYLFNDLCLKGRDWSYCSALTLELWWSTVLMQKGMITAKTKPVHLSTARVPEQAPTLQRNPVPNT